MKANIRNAYHNDAINRNIISDLKPMPLTSRITGAIFDN